MLKLSAPAHVENSNSLLSALVMIQARTLAVDGEQLDCSVSCWYHGKHSGLCLQVELRDAYGHKDGEGLDEYQVHTVSGLVTIGGGPRSVRPSARRFVHWLRMNENEEAGSGRRSLAPLKDREPDEALPARAVSLLPRQLIFRVRGFRAVRNPQSSNFTGK